MLCTGKIPATLLQTPAMQTQHMILHLHMDIREVRPVLPVLRRRSHNLALCARQDPRGQGARPQDMTVAVATLVIDHRHKDDPELPEEVVHRLDKVKASMAHSPLFLLDEPRETLEAIEILEILETLETLEADVALPLAD
ncbi:hypothetical protein N7456_006668 [Penicillium angulare]|uniref:Uncharacterized protein n=1 Tax=Penicillium angulare TaxID=116970 RepID=A0A9W9FI48_9EURO|nr:hypothetical protein N7456_006668 [Penicillium angulare]